MAWINKEELGIKEKEYKQIIKKYPVIKQLEDFIEEYNDFMESEYNNCECMGGDMFKKIYNILKEKH